MKFASCLVLCAGTALAYPEAAEREKVKFWDDLAVQYGFDYEIHTAVTEDDWELTLFRIIGRDGEADREPSSKPPVLLQHGNTQDAAFWLATSDLAQEGDPWMLQLVDRGYDIWMSSNRGTRYSNVNKNFPDADDKSSPNYAEQNAAKYDWSWFEMGIYDQPANIKKILEVTEAEKVTYVGYSQGTTQMFVGLSQLEESFFADRLNKAIMLAPCMFIAPQSYDFYSQLFPVLKERGLNLLSGPDYEKDIESLCTDLPQSAACFIATSTYEQYAQANSRKSLEYYLQVSAVGRFQEFIADYETTDSLVSPLISPGFDSIDKVPIQFVLAASDETCPVSAAEGFKNQIKSMAGYTFLPDFTAGHTIFALINTPEWVDFIVNQIELEVVIEDKTETDDCQGQGQADSARMLNLTIGGAATLFFSAVALF